MTALPSRSAEVAASPSGGGSRRALLLLVLGVSAHSPDDVESRPPAPRTFGNWSSFDRAASAVTLGVEICIH